MFRVGPVTITKTFLVFAGVFVLAMILAIVRANFAYTSAWDEQTHLSYVQYAWQGMIPANGYPMNSWAKAAFSCHPHSITGRMTMVPCGVIGDGSLYPTGGTNTSQAWPPVYFILASIIMRPFQLFISDPLIAARYATAVLWSLGVAFLSAIMWKRNHRIEQALTTGLLLVALPIFGYFSSFVGPHSMNALIAAGLLAVAFRWIDSFRLSSRVQRYLWPGVFVLSSALAAATVPQSILTIAIVSVFVTISVALESRLTPRQRVRRVLGVIAAQVIACAASLLVYWFWLFLVTARAIPQAATVDPSKANVDPAHTVYPSALYRVLDRFWAFWPNGLNPGWPSTPPVLAITTAWTFLLLSLSLAAIIFWRKSDWLSKLMLSLLIAAPIVSVGFDYVFTTNIPVRYGLGAAVIGILAVNNRAISRPMARIVLGLALATYLVAFMFAPLYVAAPGCALGADHLIDCIAR